MNTPLARRIVELEKRSPSRPSETPEQRVARVQEMLIAAFGEADMAAAEALHDNHEVEGETKADA
jgi:hypothetical protein